MKYLATLFSTVLFTLFLTAQEDVTYQLPHPDILKYADVDLPPVVRLDDAKEIAVFLSRNQYKSLAELSEPELRLAGLRINPKTNIGSRTRYYNGASLFTVSDQKESPIKGLPSPVRLANFSWSPDQKHFSVTNTTEKGVELWVVDVSSAMAKKLTDPVLNANMGQATTWLDNSHLLISILPTDRKPLIDAANAIPTGPTVSANEGEKAQNRTYQDLLSSKADEFNFEQLSKAEIRKVSIDGVETGFLPVGMYSSISVSPDKQKVLVEAIKRPFSYLVPYYRFPYQADVYDASGKHVKMIYDAPLDEVRPKGFMSTKLGKRNIGWRNDLPATLYWVEAVDGGDANEEADFRDEVFAWDAPFTTKPKSMGKTTLRYAGIEFGSQDLAVLYEYWYDTRTMKQTVFNPNQGIQSGRLFVERNYQDLYSDPGDFLTKRNEYGRSVLWQEGDKLYLAGDGYSDEGILPFFDEMDVKTLETNRLWRAKPGDKLEEIVDVIDVKNKVILERIESPTMYPNYYVRKIGQEPKQVTFFKNPFEDMKGVTKEVIEYKRDDGVDLSATLYLPADYDKSSGEKLPMLLWAYPREYKDKSTAGQKSSSPNEFTYLWAGSPIFWVNRGYAVLDRAAFPIVGEGDEEPNDSFIPQLVANAQAAIDDVANRGYIDRNRVAVGGHSYGAFMTANLLTHSDLFAAGIARSGAYNRSLTPFGFQSEQRNFWEAPEIYFTMSPFMNAEKMKHPLLLIHGTADNNSGTYPMQSERYFNALKGLGATVRLVMLPNESHGYNAYENVMHMLWEQDQWLEKYVKNKGE